MSDNQTRQRNPAKRVFATELNRADTTLKLGDDDFAPKYLVLPTGELANRVFTVAPVTEVDGRDSGVSVKLHDPTGNMYMFAHSQHQPDVASTCREMVSDDDVPPAYAAVVAKPDTFETDDGDTRVSLSPESISVFCGDEEEGTVPDYAAGDQLTGDAIRKRFNKEAAKHTINRLKNAEDGFDEFVGHLDFDPVAEYEQDRSRIRDGVAETISELDPAASA